MDIKQIGNTQYYVIHNVPTVKSMVLNNAFLPVEEIKDSLHSWNMKPVVIKHTKENGKGVTASKLSKIAEHIGFTTNATMEGDRMRVDFYLRKDALEAHPDGQRLINSVQSGKQVNVSTAYFDQSIAAQGVKDGKKYDRIQQKLNPDHTAILLDESGACSTSDNCGFNVNEKGVEKLDEKDLGVFVDSLITQMSNLEGKVAELNQNAALPDGSGQAFKDLAESHKKLHERMSKMEKDLSDMKAKKDEEETEKSKGKKNDEEADNKTDKKLAENSETVQERSYQTHSINENSQKVSFSGSTVGFRPSPLDFLKEQGVK